MRREDLRTDNQQTAGDVNQTEIRMISIVIQAFYGNRTGTEVYIDNLDRLILGDIDTRYPLMPYQRIDRTIIKLPGRDNVVLIYNKYEEERSLKRKEKLLKEEGYHHNTRSLCSLRSSQEFKGMNIC